MKLNSRLCMIERSSESVRSGQVVRLIELSDSILRNSAAL